MYLLETHHVFTNFFQIKGLSRFPCNEGKIIYSTYCTDKGRRDNKDPKLNKLNNRPGAEALGVNRLLPRPTERHKIEIRKKGLRNT